MRILKNISLGVILKGFSSSFALLCNTESHASTFWAGKYDGYEMESPSSPHTYTATHTHVRASARAHARTYTHTEIHTISNTHMRSCARAHILQQTWQASVLFETHKNAHIYKIIPHKMTIRLVTIRNGKNGSLLQTAFDTTDDYEVFDIKHSQEPVAMCFFTSDENHSSLPPFGINRIKTQCSPCLLPTHTRTSPWRYHFNAIRLALVWCFYLDAVIICST